MDFVGLEWIKHKDSDEKSYLGPNQGRLQMLPGGNLSAI